MDMDLEQRFKVRFMKPEESGRVSKLVNALQAYQKMKKCPRLPKAEDFMKELTHSREDGARIGNNLTTFVVVAIDSNRIGEPDNAEIIGYLIYSQAFCIINDRYFYMNSFFIEEDYRHHGLGKKLMKFMRLHAITIGNNRVDVPFMNDNIIGQKFYEKFGSYPVNEEYEILSIDIKDNE